MAIGLRDPIALALPDDVRKLRSMARKPLLTAVRIVTGKERILTAKREERVGDRSKLKPVIRAGVADKRREERREKRKRREDLRAAVIEDDDGRVPDAPTCKPRPETNKGAGGSRFVPWCRKR